ncbi:lipase family protein, partial [Helicobacter didelphidarum]|uniref:lipase family protein n=1 Tax=Helicobacter didelphidarum TaxID=2040648 RepID=UPI0038B40383
LLKDSTQEATLENFISPIDSNTKLNITGHSLGGALTQMLVLSLCDDKNEANINEAYTFNSPGARDLKPPYDTIIYYTTDTKEMIAKQLREKAGKTNKYIFETNSKINYMLNKIAKNNNTHFGINFCVDTAGEEDRASVTYKKIDNALVCFYETLIKNYEKGNTKVDKENKYKLSISDRVHHIESSTNEEANKCYISSPIALLGEDIAGLYHTINEKEGSHSIKYLTWYLYLYDYLLSDVNVNSKWEWNLDNLNRFIQMVFHLNKNHFKMFKTDTNKSKTEKTKITNIHKTPLLTIISDLLFITRDTLFECQIFAKGFYDNEEIKKRLDENYAIDTLMLMQEHNIELKLFSFYRDEQSLLDKTLFKVSTFYSLYAFKPYEVYKNNKAYLTKDNLELVFGYNADFAQCFYGKDKILHIESAKNIEYGYMKHFHILWNNPQDVDEKSPIVNMGNINNNKASFILIKGE